MTLPVVSNCMQTQENTAYVYAFMVDGVIRYIGKGRDRRMHAHMTIVRHILNGRRHRKEQVVHRRMAAAIKESADVQWAVIKSRLSDAEAFALEIDTIASIHKDDLWNVCEGGRGCSSADALERWSRPEYRAKQAEKRADPEVRRHKSESGRITQNIPEVRERVKAAQRAAFATPESKARLIARTKKFWATPGYREAVVAGRKAQWTPETRASASAKHKALWTDEKRAERSAKYKAMWADPERLALILSRRAATMASNRANVNGRS